MADNSDYAKLAAQYPALAAALGGFHPDSAPISDMPDAPKPGFFQSIGNALSGNPMLQSAAHPQTAGDIASLLLPSGAAEAVSGARKMVQGGVDATKAVDTGAGVIARVNQFGGDRSVRGVGGLHVEAPGGMSSITPGEWEKLQKAGGTSDMAHAPSASPSISVVDPEAHRDLLIRLMQRQMGTGPNLQEKFTQSNALEAALAKERQAANMASRTR